MKRVVSSSSRHNNRLIDLDSAIYQALAGVAFECYQAGQDFDKNDVQVAVDHFMQKFFTD